MIIKKLLLVVILSLLCNFSCSATKVNCEIYTRASLEINGYSHIEPQIFGLNAYEGANQFDYNGPYGSKTGYKFLNTYGIESIGMSGNIPWVFPRGTNTFQKELTLQQVNSWFDNGASWYFNSYGGGDRYVQGRILPTIKKYTSAIPWLFLVGTSPFGENRKGRYPINWERWSLAATRYIGLALKANPDLTYVHLLNEPNSHWFKAGKGGTDYANFFLQAATAIHTAYPQIKIGGPVLCWPPTFPEDQTHCSPWYTWRSYSKPLIDIAHKQLDFFDFHAYDYRADGNILAGEIHIIAAYSKALYNKWLRSAITESNIGINDEQWANRSEHYNLRTVPMIKQTMALLKYPDKVFVRQVHDFSALLHCNYRFRNSGDIPPTPMMEFYKIMKPLRGTRLFVKGNSKDVMIEAAQGRKYIVVALFNQASTNVNIRINLRGIHDYAVSDAQGEILDAKSLRPFSVKADESIMLPPQSLAVITYRLKYARPPKYMFSIKEYFADGDSVMQFSKLNEPLSYTIELPSDIAKAKNAKLCFGIKGPASKETWLVDIDNDTYKFTNPGAYHELLLRKIPHSGKHAVLLTQISGTNNVANCISFVSLKIGKIHLLK